MPRRIVTAGIAALLVFWGLMTLGMWQVQRLHWKEGLIAQITAGLNGPPRDLPDVFGKDSPDDIVHEFEHVSAKGSLMTDKPLFIYGRTLNGKAGVEVIVALETSRGMILVDRGFMPVPINPSQAAAPATSATIDGLIRIAGGKNWFDPANQPSQNEWFYVDPPAMAKSLGLASLPETYIEAIAPTATDGPIPTGARLLANIPNNHLQYAITWFGLAAVCAGVYAVWAWPQLKAARRP